MTDERAGKELRTGQTAPRVRSANFLISVALCVLALSVTARLQSGIIVDLNDVRQRMDGFGAADVFDGALSDAQADLFFSTSSGIGLSILRVGIDENGNDLSAYSNATKAAARGAIVWAAPWTAPAAWKDNNSTINGGHLLPADYDLWATRLAAFAGKLQQNAGVPLYGLSAQNEPDYTAPYISMLYTNQEMVNFVKVLGPKLAALNPRPKLIMPEVANWGSAWGFTGAVLSDSIAAPYVDIFAVHQYGGVAGPDPQALVRPIWETEQSSFEGFDTSIGNGIMVAKWIHDAIITGNVSAWHYWWLIGLNGDNEGLLGGGGQTTKRLYTLGNFSKFVRPGFVRVGATGAPGGVDVSAYKDPVTNAVAIVAINESGANVPFTVTMNGSTAATVTPWVTSATENLVAHAPISVGGGSFSTTLSAATVTTFVAGASSPPPPDTTPPSVPTGLSASAVSSSQINLSWTASTDNVAVTGYRIYRNGTQVGTASTTVYGDTGLSISTSYSYTVAAYDAAGNVSAPSTSASATTLGPASPSLTSLSPTAGGAGTVVTVTGANFGSSQGTSTIQFNGTSATPTSWSSNSIAVPVPNGATTGPVVVTVNGNASNGITFTVNVSSSLPAPWTSQDIGNPAVVGSVVYAAGAFTVWGAGADIWTANDQFRFVFQPLNGDGTIVARVDSLLNTDPWAKAGVMIRADLTNSAPNAFVTLTSANGMSFQQRGTAGGQTSLVSVSGIAAPQWVRLVRSGNTLTGYYSANGTAWTQIGTATITLPTQAYVGLAVTSHNPLAITTVGFSNVAVSTVAPPTAPTGLTIR